MKLSVEKFPMIPAIPFAVASGNNPLIKRVTSLTRFSSVLMSPSPMPEPVPVGGLYIAVLSVPNVS